MDEGCANATTVGESGGGSSAVKLPHARYASLTAKTLAIGGQHEDNV